MISKVRFYTDEQIPRAIVRGLRQRGVDVLTAPEAGMLGASDREHLEKARHESRVLITLDDDFLRLAAEGVVHAGIFYAPQGTSVGEMIYGVMLIYQVMSPEEMEGHVEYL